jgi:hypothetical protein
MLPQTAEGHRSYAIAESLNNLAEAVAGLVTEQSRIRDTLDQLMGQKI